MLRITVGHESENYTSVQEAINAVPYNTEAEIEIHEGIYCEKIFSDKSNLTIRGTGCVRIVCSDGAKEILDRNQKRGTFRSYTAFFSGEKLHISNVSFINDAGNGSIAGQAVALYLDVDNAVLEHVTLSSYQDTLFLSPLPDEEREINGFYGPRYLLPRKRCMTVIKDSLIEGTVDFIFGWSTAVFNRCTIRSVGNGYVTAPSTDEGEAYGYVFFDCNLTASEGVDKVYLSRPWRPYGQAVFIRCRLGKHIVPEGWHNWGKKEAEKTVYYAEYESTGEGACPEQRASFSRQLENADDFTLEKILGGDDGWSPFDMIR